MNKSKTGPRGGSAPIPARPEAVGRTLVRAEGREQSAAAFEAEVVAYFVDAAEMLGVPKSVAAIYGVCFANAEPLSFADVVARLNISQGSISQGIRILRDVGALRKVGTHDRRDYFAPELKLRNLAERFLEERLEKQVVGNRQRLMAINKALSPAHPSADELRHRLDYLKGWNEKVRSLVPIAKAFLKLG